MRIEHCHNTTSIRELQSLLQSCARYVCTQETANRYTMEKQSMLMMTTPHRRTWPGMKVSRNKGRPLQGSTFSLDVVIKVVPQLLLHLSIVEPTKEHHLIQIQEST